MSANANCLELQQQIASATKAGRRPVAVLFVDEPPMGVKKIEGTEPSGCSFWRLAAAG